MISLFKSVESFAAFLKNWILTGGKLVDQEVANARAKICASCHSNKSSNEVRKTCCGGGQAANMAVFAARQLIIQGKSTPYDKDLLTCEHCGCDNKISVWIPNEVLLHHNDANAFPTFCYKKKILEGKEV